MEFINKLKAYPNIYKLLNVQLNQTPEQSKFFEKRFSENNDELNEITDLLSGQIIALVGQDKLESLASDYQWMCSMLLQEEEYFRRNGTYRLKTVDEAVHEVYSNDAFMQRYLNGLLISQVWWSNHTSVFQFYKNKFLKKNAVNYRHLEVGPGHGLFLFQACNDENCESASAWDIAPQSIESSKEALKHLNVQRMPDFYIQDLLNVNDEHQKFNSIVVSEVIEHLDQPAKALNILKKILHEDGRMFINIPINSPAPDHLFLLKTTDEVVNFIEGQELEIEEFIFAPQTNFTLEKARKLQLTVSCGVIVRHGS